MDILILGGTRFVGKSVADALVLSGHKVTIISRNPLGADKNAIVYAGERDLIISGVSKKISCDLILDFTGYQPSQVNIALNLFPNAAYIFISSIWVSYLNQQLLPDLPADTVAIKNNKLLVETKNYIINKAQCEHEIIRAKNNGSNSIVIRLPIIWGEHDHTKRFNFYLDRILDKQGLILVDGGLNTVSVGFKDDVVLAIKKLIVMDFKKLNPIMEASCYKEKMTTKTIIEKIAISSGERVDFHSMSANFLKKKLPGYLLNEPLWREHHYPQTNNNLLLHTGISASSMDDWLSEMVFKSKKNSSIQSDLRMKELALIKMKSYEM